MAIFLTILKIIGIVLLCIIGLILLIILYVLLAPFWFKVQGSIDREMNYCVKVKACTFLHFIQVHIDYLKDEGLNYNVSILGTLVKILPRKEKPEEEADKDETSIECADETAADTSDTLIESTDEAATDINETSAESTEENATAESTDIETNIDVEESEKDVEEQKKELEEIEDIDIHSSDIVDTESEDFEEKYTEEEKSFFVKVREFFSKFSPKKIIDSIKTKIEFLKSKADKIYEIVFDEANKDWLKKIFRELKKLIKSLGLNMRGTDLDFSLGSPDTTGQVSGALALFPPIYDKKVRVIPDFNDDNLYFDGNVIIKGRLHLVCVVYFVLVILLDKNTKKIINKIKNKE